jgi:hypothetical protein
MINDTEAGIELTLSITDSNGEKMIYLRCRDQRTDIAVATTMPVDLAIATGLAILNCAEKAESGSVDRYLDALQEE